MKPLMILAALLTAGAADAQSRWAPRGEQVRTFATPQYRGLPLDICPSDVGIDGLLRGRCGMPVAQDFCRMRGFAEALDAPHRGGIGPTQMLSGQVVEHQWATGFRYITCAR
jgi:hypothetical protein